jgi:paraquat-inducible protein B
MMTQPDTDSAYRRAVTRRSRRISIIWLVPVVALLIGAWLAWDTLSKQGPTITVQFDSAEGLQAGQSQLKYKDIVFGTVKKLELTPDKWHVVVTIETTREAEPLLTDKTVFWVVKPRLFAGSISGLSTVLSGSYVGLVPGQGGAKKHDFVGQEDPPVLEEHTPGRVFELKSPRIGSISTGSTIFYRGIEVGEVLGWDVSHMAESVTIRAFVRAPYDAYVRDETRFWNDSGLSINLGAHGVQVEVQSLKALLFGGIEFDTAPNDSASPQAAENHAFPLFADQDDAKSASYTRAVDGVSYFSGSVSGLAAGSEVTMHGMKIGEVTDVRLAPVPAKGIVAVVRYQVQPERVVGVGKRTYKTDEEAVAAMLDLGLRASVESANLLTGQQVVALEFVADAPHADIVMDGKDFVVPTTEGGGFAGLAASASAVLSKVNTIPFAQIGANLNGVLGSVNQAVEGPELKAAVADLAATLAAAHDLVQKVSVGASPAAKQLPEIAATLQKALTNANKLAVSVDDGYGNDTKFHRDLDRLLVQTDEAVRGIRSLADLLSRQPEALIKGRHE